MATARTIMSPDLFLLDEDTKIDVATQKFKRLQFTSAPVVNAKGKVLGILTELGLMRAALMPTAKSGGRTVRDYAMVMTPASFIEATATSEQVIKALIQAPSHRLVVMESENVVGIISPKDVLQCMGEQLRAPADDAKARQRSDAALIYQSIFEQSPYMMHSVGPDGTIALANRKLHEVLGFEYGELIGRPMLQLYLEKFKMQAQNGLEWLKKEGHGEHVLTSMRHKNGEMIPVELHSSSIHGANGSFQGTVTVARRLDADAKVKSIVELLGAIEGDTPKKKAS